MKACWVICFFFVFVNDTKHSPQLGSTRGIQQLDTEGQQPHIETKAHSTTPSTTGVVPLGRRSRLYSCQIPSTFKAELVTASSQDPPAVCKLSEKVEIYKKQFASGESDGQRRSRHRLNVTM